MALRKYRVNRDWDFPNVHWAVEIWRLWWPFWVEYRGLLTKEDATELLAMLRNPEA